MIIKDPINAEKNPHTSQDVEKLYVVQVVGRE